MSDIKDIIITEDYEVIQKHILNILAYVTEIMDKDRIPYFIVEESLEEAYYYKEFSKESNNFCFAVPRGYYEKFIRYCREMLPDSIKVKNFEDESEYCRYCTRIIDTKCAIKGSDGFLYESGIDIYPLDGMPTNPFINKLHSINLAVTKSKYLALDESFDKSILPFGQRMLVAFIGKLPFGKNKTEYDYLKKIDKILKRVDIRDSKYLVNFMGNDNLKGVVALKTDYGKGRMYEFEDMMLKGPVNCEAFF